MGMKRLGIHTIRPNPDQPRKDFQEIPDLGRSIAEKGLQQPITVRPIKDDPHGHSHEIVFGERRWRAHKWLAANGRLPDGTILCHVRAMSDDERDSAATVENLQRADITPFEEAMAFKRELDKGKTVEELARELGLSQSWRISYRLRLLNLNEATAKLARAGSISLNDAQEIARLPEREQLQVVQRLNAGRISSGTSVSAAVNALLFKDRQPDFMMDAGTGPSEAERLTVNKMERTVEQLCLLIARGWQDGECVVAVKIAPDKASLFAYKLKFAAKTMINMEKQLRTTGVARDMLKGCPR